METDEKAEAIAGTIVAFALLAIIIGAIYYMYIPV